MVSEGKNPLRLDSRDPKIPLRQYVQNETRYTMLMRSNPEAAEAFLKSSQRDIEERWKLYKHLASMEYGLPVEEAPPLATPSTPAEVAAQKGME
jgi:pyruvate-ferredoxin/flavodoxin oxidoreductase